MGIFSYICPHCKKSIRGGEIAHLRHIRHGKVLGETVGYYDCYGRVYGLSRTDSPVDPNYRRWADEMQESGYPNTHEEICKSEFEYTDSEGFRGKVLGREPVDWIRFRNKLGCPIPMDVPESAYEQWRSLPDYVPERIASGTSAYHEYCWNRISKEEKNQNFISAGDPDQGCGKPRKKYWVTAKGG